MRHRESGFTLIELMITVAIVAILAAVAYPSYLSQIRRSHRTEGKDVLLQIQLAQEKYFLSNNVYGSLDNLMTSPLTVPGLKKSGTTYYTTNSYYKVTMPVQTTTTFTAQVDANGSQDKDIDCATFSVKETGAKSPTNSDCWNK